MKAKVDPQIPIDDRWSKELSSPLICSGIFSVIHTKEEIPWKKKSSVEMRGCGKVSWARGTILKHIDTFQKMRGYHTNAFLAFLPRACRQNNKYPWKVYIFLHWTIHENIEWILLFHFTGSKKEYISEFYHVKKKYLRCVQSKGQLRHFLSNVWVIFTHLIIF